MDVVALELTPGPKPLLPLSFPPAGFHPQTSPWPFNCAKLIADILVPTYEVIHVGVNLIVAVDLL